MVQPAGVFQLSSVIIAFLVCVKFSGQFEDKKFLSYHDYETMRGVDIIKYWGYPGEEHKVTTEDGYILTNFRIANPGGYPVILFHGLTASSDCFLVRNPAVDFVFLLWKRGYDVWLWNARGNLYSKEHVNMTSKQEKFYLFSIHEEGIYDTTATIDYILNLTGHKSVITVGHSMGATNAMIATSMRPEYLAKVGLSIIWAQAAIMKHLIIKGYADMYYSMYVRFVNFDNTQRILETNDLAERMTRLACHPKSITGWLCYLYMAMGSGLGSNQTTQSAVAKMMLKFPTGTSLNTLKQMIQMARTGEFGPLSYGKKENLKRYGTRFPRPYPLGNISTPTAIYYSCCNDYLSHAKDSYTLKRKLKNVVRFKAIPYKMFNHGDFLWARDSYRLLYKDVLDLIDEYNPGHRKPVGLGSSKDKDSRDSSKQHEDNRIPRT